jgi:hypothetical protein
MEKRHIENGGYRPAKGIRRVASGLLRLAPGRARVIEVDYTANTFIDSEKTIFRYRLEGEDQDWQEAQTRRVALYTNLRPGKYHFRVEARNHHGYWSEHPAEFEFEIQPHLYQTWPFYCVVRPWGRGGPGGMAFSAFEPCAT